MHHFFYLFSRVSSFLHLFIYYLFIRSIYDNFGDKYLLSTVAARLQNEDLAVIYSIKI